MSLYHINQTITIIKTNYLNIFFLDKYQHCNSNAQTISNLLPKINYDVKHIRNIFNHNRIHIHKKKKQNNNTSL